MYFRPDTASRVVAPTSISLLLLRVLHGKLRHQSNVLSSQSEETNGRCCFMLIFSRKTKFVLFLLKKNFLFCFLLYSSFYFFQLSISKHGQSPLILVPMQPPKREQGDDVIQVSIDGNGGVQVFGGDRFPDTNSNNQCTGGQEFNRCGTACPPTCDRLGPVACTRQCVIGCQCPRRAPVLHNGVCITAEQCPQFVGLLTFYL